MVQSRRRQENIEVQVGERFPLTIRRLGVNGQGIGYFKHKVCFVPGALPHEVVVAEVTVLHQMVLVRDFSSLYQCHFCVLNKKTEVNLCYNEIAKQH